MSLTPCPHCGQGHICHVDRDTPDYRAFLRWLVKMDEPDSQQRRTVTLTQIIEKARGLL